MIAGRAQVRILDQAREASPASITVETHQDYQSALRLADRGLLRRGSTRLEFFHAPDARHDA